MRNTKTKAIKQQPPTAVASSDLLAAFDDALNENPFLMFELGYTRITDWMVHIWDKRGGGEPRKIITTQHPSRAEACRQAAKLLRRHTEAANDGTEARGN